MANGELLGAVARWFMCVCASVQNKHLKWRPIWFVRWGVIRDLGGWRICGWPKFEKFMAERRSAGEPGPVTRCVCVCVCACVCVCVRVKKCSTKLFLILSFFFCVCCCLFSCSYFVRPCYFHYFHVFLFSVVVLFVLLCSFFCLFSLLFLSLLMFSFICSRFLCCGCTSQFVHVISCYSPCPACLC